MFEWLGTATGIVLVDLVLSGDNAVVIGAAAAGLSQNQRLMAILLGGGGAVVLRILFALAATLLLDVHYLGLIGGIILLFIAVRILVDASKERLEKKQDADKQTETEHKDGVPLLKKPRRGFLGAIFTILIADVTMSLDNVLAVAGLAKETPWLLIAGLVLSIAILLAGSALIARLIDRLPLLLDVACLVVAWSAVHIFMGDDALHHFVNAYPWVEIAAIIVVWLVVLAVDVYLHRRERHILRGVA